MPNKIILKNKRDNLTGTVVVPDFKVGEDAIVDQKNQLNFKWDNKTSSFKSRGNTMPKITLYTLEVEQN